MISSITVGVGTQVKLPFPPPMTLDTDNPAVLAISLDRDSASIKATSIGEAWVNVGLAGDLRLAVKVTVQDEATMKAAAGYGPTGPAGAAVKK